MKLDDQVLKTELQNSCEYFSEQVSTNFQKFLGQKLEAVQEVMETDEQLKHKDLHISILFNGSIYGEFILSLSKQSAVNLVADPGDNFEACKEDVFDALREILNISVGKTMEVFSDHFKHLTITSPKVTVGEMHLPKMPVLAKTLVANEDKVSCSLYIDQMKLTIAAEYEDSVQLLDQAEQQKEQLKLLNKAKTQFLAKMSHELRTPLNGIIGNLDLLKRTALNTLQRQQIDTVSKSGDFLLSIINDILDFSKIESGNLQLEERSFHLCESIEPFLDGISNHVFAKGLNFSVRIDPDLPESIVSDETRLRQVLMNLIGNAVKFTPAGKIEVSLTRVYDFIEISVEDTGVGIPKDKLDSVFESFIQAEVSDNRRYGGSGLGLTISKSIVEAMGGHLIVKSEEAVGTKFSLLIPLLEGSYTEKTSEKRNQSENSIQVISKDSTLCENVLFYLNKFTARAETAPNWELPESDVDHIFIDWKAWNDMTSQDRQQAAVQLKDKGISCHFLIQPSQIVEVEEQKEILEGLKGAILKVPVMPEKLALSFQPGRIISFGEQPQSDVPSVTTEPAKSIGTEPILLVEDNLINQQIAKSMLETFGLTVEVASNGEEAVEKAKTKTYKFILMDCQMPIMDGYKATEIIRNSANPNTKTTIIALTANAFKEVKERCFDQGMNDFATKPIRLEQLKTLVDQHS